MLTRHWKDRDACYVALLNVHPSARGKGIGKRLLLAAVERAYRLGLSRVDLHTWQGNVRAIGLYKKAGFFWVPGTHVYMQNYVPMLLRAFNQYLAGVDWYRSLDRSTEAREDLGEWMGLRVFTYRWRLGEGVLVARVDWEARAICYASTPDFELAVWPQSPRPLKGSRLRVGVRLAGRGCAAEALLALEPPEGVRLGKRAVAIRAPAGRAAVEEVEAEVLPDAPEPLEEYEEDALAVRVHASLAGCSLPMGFSLRPQPPVSVTAHPSPPTGLPGSRVRVRLVLASRCPTRARVAVSGVSAEPGRFEAELEPGAVMVRELSVQLPEKPGVRRGLLRVFAEWDGGSYRAAVPLNAKAVVPGRLVGSVEEGGRVVRFDSPWSRVEVSLKGGHLLLYHGELDVARLAVDAVGPPFRPSALDYARYAVASAEEDRLVLEARIPGREHVVLRKEYEFLSDELVRIKYSFTNESDKPENLQLEVLARVDRPVGALYTSTGGGLAWKTYAGGYPIGEGDAPYDPSAHPGGWAVYDAGYKRIGLAWSPGSCEKVEFSWSPIPSLRFKPVSVPPLSTVSLPPIYVYAGPRGWREVQRLLAAAVGGRPAGARGSKALEVDLDTWAVPLGGGTEAELSVRWRRGRSLRGTLSLKPVGGVSVEPGQLEVGGTARLPLRLSCRARRPGFAGVKWTLLQDGEVARGFAPLAVVGDGCVRVEEGEEDGHRVVVLDNGLLRAYAAPGFGGCVYALKEEGVNRLATSFPTPRPYSWVNPWYGGIRLSAAPSHKRKKSYLEEWRWRPAARGELRGFELYSNLGRSYEELRGFTARLGVLAAPGARFVVLEAEVKNGGGRPLELDASLTAWPAATGVEIAVPGLRVRPVEYGAYPYRLARAGWAVVSSGEAHYVWVARASHHAYIGAYADSAREYPLAYAESISELAPGESIRIAAALALASSPSEAKAAKALASKLLSRLYPEL